MRKILVILFVLIASFAKAQYAPMTAYGYKYKRLMADSTLHIPNFCGVASLRDTTTKKAAIAFDSCNNRLYFYNPKTFTWGYFSGSGFDTTTIYETINNILTYIYDTSFTNQFMPAGIVLDTTYFVSGTQDSVRAYVYTDGTVIYDTLGRSLLTSITNNITNILNILDSARSDTSFYISTILNGDTLLKVHHDPNSPNDTIFFTLAHADATHDGYVSAGGSAAKILHGDGVWRDTTAAGGGGGSGWGLTGNSGTTSGTNFIGTTDNQSFKFRTNNLYAGMVDSLSRWTISKTAGVKGGSYRYGLWVDSAVVIGDTSQWKPYTTSANNTLAPFVNIRKDWNGSTILAVENQSSGDRSRAALAVLGETAFGVTPDVNNRYGLMQVTSTTRDDTAIGGVIVPANTFMVSSGGGLAGGLILYSDNGTVEAGTNLHLGVPPGLYISSFSNPDGTSRNVVDTNYVGIYTRNPSSLFHVGNGTLASTYITAAYGSTSGHTGGIALKSGTGYTTKWLLQANTSGTTHDFVVQEGTNSTNKIQVLQGTAGNIFLNPSGGNVQVGTTSTPSFLLEVNKSQNAATTLGILNSTNGTAATSTLWLGESSGGNYSLLRHYARANTNAAPYEGGSLLLQNSSDGNINYVTYGAFGHKFWVDNATGTAFNPMRISQAGHLLFTDNTYDIGASGATRPRTGYFGTSIYAPLHVGGTSTTQTITYQTTTGVGATGADHIWKGGNNGATEFMRILNDGSIGIGTASPDKLVTIAKSSTGQVAMDMLNAGTGTASTVNLFMGEGATLTGLKYAGLNYYNNSYTTSGAAIANSIRFFSETVNGLQISANHATGLIRFYTGGVADANERMRVSAAGVTSLFKGADVASAATITATGNSFHVTGTTNITSVSGTNITAGTTVTIIFDGVLTFTDGSNLKLAGDFITTSDDTITLLYDGTNFYEVTRAVN